MGKRLKRSFKMVAAGFPSEVKISRQHMEGDRPFPVLLVMGEMFAKVEDCGVNVAQRVLEVDEQQQGHPDGEKVRPKGSKQVQITLTGWVKP